MVDLAVVGRGDDVVRGHVKWRGFGAEGVKDVGGEVGGKAGGDVVVVVGVSAWLAAQDRNAAAGILTLSVSGEVEVEELVRQRTAIRSVGRSGRADGEDLERSCPRKGELGFEHEVVGVLLGALANGGRAVVDPSPVANFKHREVVEGLDELGVATLDPGGSKGVKFPNQVVSVALAVHGEVAVGQLISVEALVPTHVGVVEEGKRKTRETADVDFVGCQTSGLADGIVVGELDVREDGVPVVLTLVDGDSEHLCHGVVDTLGTTVGLRVVRTGSDFVDTEEVVDGGGKLGGELEAVVGDEGGGTSP